MTGGDLLQAVLTGLSIGAVYGLVGIGFVLVWSLTRVIPLAHGDVVVGSVLLAVAALLGRHPSAVPPSLLRSVLLVLATVAVGVLLSVGVYVAAVRPFLDPRTGSADVVGWAAGGVTAALVIRAAVTLALPAAAYAVPDPLHLDSLTSSGSLRLPGDTSLPVRVLPVLAIAVVVAVLTDLVLRRTRWGRAVRAVAEDRAGAALCGLSAERIVIGAFALAGGLAAIAGILDAPAQAVSADSGPLLGLAGGAAALLAGMASARGAMLGGLAIGVVQQVVAASSDAASSWATLLPLLVLVAALVVRPLGRRRGEPAMP
jgi:branched-chain amino acid transport system permease protein